LDIRPAKTVEFACQTDLTLKSLKKRVDNKVTAETQTAPFQGDMNDFDPSLFELVNPKDIE